MNDEPTIAAPPPPDNPPALLFIDDEPSVLAALKRLFRPLGYRIFTADSGAAGLALLEKEPVDVVVSDMRMPEMNGAEVLERIRLKYPDTMRILLTGYADVGSTIAAINRGEIYRYAAKPWDDDEIVLTVRQALERKLLQAEKQRLEILICDQNEELRALNLGLEERVRGRSEALRKAMTLLQEEKRRLEELTRRQDEELKALAARLGEQERSRTEALQQAITGLQAEKQRLEELTHRQDVELKALTRLEEQERGRTQVQNQTIAALQAEKHHLETLARRQNQELETLNASLEEQLSHNTEALADTPENPEVSPEAPLALLFVDDEANILSALKRLFRPHGYRIHTAGGGSEALELLEREAVDLVVSDMRMPGMNGAEVLEQVRRKYPDTVRILLTGYADIESTVAAINRGEIYRYISKPWNDDEIVMTVKQALERKALQAEKRRLEALTRRQNEELKELNASLEARVLERTAELHEANRKLKDSFIISIKVFSSLMELRERSLAGHSRRVADMARTLAQRLELPDAEVQEIFVAGLLHDVGKIGLPDKLLAKPFNVLAGEERDLVLRHPVTGQAALMGLEQLAGAAKLVRHHHECWNGTGFPDALAGADIPIGARILTVANDFDAAQIGSLLNKRLSSSDALAMILEGRGKRYDPQIVDIFFGVMGKPGKPKPDELALKSASLRAGMVLSRDLLSANGFLLLSKDHRLNDSLIGQIRSYDEQSEQPMIIHVLRGV